MAVTIPLRALLPYALGALDYLLRNLLPPASPTSPVSAPYIPPFVGGQCSNVVYGITFRQTHPNPNYDFGTGEGNSRFVNRGDLNQKVGKITGFGTVVVATNQGNTTFPTVTTDYAPQPSQLNTGGGEIGGVAYTYSQFTLTPRGSGVDNCGNLSDPNPPPTTASNGLGESGSPNLDNDDVVQAGIPVIAIPSFLSALLAALQAAKSAADALAGIRAIADAIAALADLLNGLKDNADEDKKDKDKNNKEISRHDFGSIRYDGYLRLYPSAGTNGKEALYVDLQLLSIPIYYGKYFGRQSPNFYRFKSLGYISFTSPTFGIIETKEIEFSRLSLNVPANASGFFYHLGLEGDIIGNISAFYIKAK